MPDRKEHAVEVDRLLALPVGQRHLGNRRHDADAGIGHHDVEPSEPLLGLGDHTRPAGLVAHVMVQVVRLAAGLSDAPDDILAEPIIDVGDEDCSAFARQRLRTGLADAGGAAGDDRDLARDLTHLTQRPFQLPGRFSA